jgi:hypothetical protein
MTHELLHGRFARIGARVKVRREFLERGLRLDVGRDARGEFFQFTLHAVRAPVLRVLAVRPLEQRLLLEVHDHPHALARHREGRQAYLFARRKRRWYVTRVHGEALLAGPRPVHAAALAAQAGHQVAGREGAGD